MTNYGRLSEGLKLYRDTMRGFIARELRKAYPQGNWMEQGVYPQLRQRVADNLKTAIANSTGGILQGERSRPEEHLDIHHFRDIVRGNWDRAFGGVFKDRVALDWINEVGRERHIWAHPPAGDLELADVNRVLDSCARTVAHLNREVSGQLAALRDATDEAAPAPASAPSPASAGETPRPSRRSQRELKPWRDVVAPHQDVASGRYVQAEFAADLAQVLAGTADAEYQDPLEFFQRTYLTPGIVQLLGTALDRLQGQGGEPVVELKTAFGGGKTHTMLALYHLVSGSPLLLEEGELRDLLKEHRLDAPMTANRAVLVGTALSPSQGRPKPELGGGEVRTLWGEMAFQLGGVQGYQMVAEDDAAGVAPGSDAMALLFERFGPCVVLMDEIVAYCRNIRGAQRRLPSGSFEANMTFIQSLTEAVKRAPKTVLVASLPESAVEIGGSAGQEALNRIENTFRRVGAISMPVAATEAFEIVRRRLFSEVQDESARDATCAAFARLYRSNTSDFPAECREVEYERRMRSSYPIHPEVFDRLYEDWSTMERFQRTRGVLRLMAAVIHELWRAGDSSPMIMPGSLPLYAPRVRDELIRHLNDQWNAVMDEADGDESETLRIDNENQRFGQLQAARRLSRTTFLGSVPYKSTRGIEDVRLRLGVVQPNEFISTYNDALGRLQQRLQFLYTSGQGRYWFDVQPNLTRTVADRSSRITDDDVLNYLEERLVNSRPSRGDFVGIHVCPESTDDVPDEPAARLVVLSPKEFHKRGANASKALDTAGRVLQNRGTSPRRYRNMLVFAAPDEDAMETLVDETRRFLAWRSVKGDKEVLNLDRVQERQVNEAVERGEKAIPAQLDAAYQCVLSPKQEGTGPIDWEELNLRRNDLGSTGGLVQRALYRLQSSELLIPNWSPVHLRREMDDYLWKDGRPHITVKQLWDYFATYPYLSWLRDHEVLLATIKAGVYSKDYFGYATGVTDDGNYTGLVFGGPPPGVYFDDTSVVVRPQVAEEHMKEKLQDKPAGEKQATAAAGAMGTTEKGDGYSPTTQVQQVKHPRRFFATVQLNPLRMSSEAGTIGQEVIQHLEALLGANVEVTLEIEAKTPEGFPDNVVRIITENARTLKFKSFGFEEE